MSGTLQSLVDRLSVAEKDAEQVESAPVELSNDWEDYDELSDEWDDDEKEAPKKGDPLSGEQLQELRAEKIQLQEFCALAKSIVKNSKGEVLLTALRRGFGAAAKAQQDQGGRDG